MDLGAKGAVIIAAVLILTFVSAVFRRYQHSVVALIQSLCGAPQVGLG